MGGKKSQTGRLPDSELEIMQVLWQKDEMLSRTEIEEILLERGKEWDTSTVNSLLGRLKNKGYLEYEKCGKKYVYLPTISEEDYLKRESRHLLSHLFRGKPVNFIAALVKDNQISEQEIQELEAFLEEQKRR